MNSMYKRMYLNFIENFEKGDLIWLIQKIKTHNIYNNNAVNIFSDIYLYIYKHSGKKLLYFLTIDTT